MNVPLKNKTPTKPYLTDKKPTYYKRNITAIPQNTGQYSTPVSSTKGERDSVSRDVSRNRTARSTSQVRQRSSTPSNRGTTLYYKSGEIKMEKSPGTNNTNNIVLYYKNGLVLYKGTILGASTPLEGSWYYDNGQLYYSGTFSKQNTPEGENCILHYENGDKKFIGKIEKGFVKMEQYPEMKLKPEFGKQSIQQQTKEEHIEIPRGLITFQWPIRFISDSRFLKEFYSDETELKFMGSLKNGYLDGDGFLYFESNQEETIPTNANDERMVHTTENVTGSQQKDSPQRPDRKSIMRASLISGNSGKNLSNPRSYNSSKFVKSTNNLDELEVAPFCYCGSPSKHEVANHKLIEEGQSVAINDEHEDEDTECCAKKLPFEKDDNLILFFRGHFKQGKIHGPVNFHLNTFGTQHCIFIGSMFKGKLHGPSKFYYNSGKLFVKGVWADDELSGDKISGFYENGKQYFEGLFNQEGGQEVKIYDRKEEKVIFIGKTQKQNNQDHKVEWKEGTSYDRITGYKKCQGTWVNSKLDGDNIICYSTSGYHLSTGYYQAGVCTYSKEFWRDGKLKLKAGWVNNRWHGFIGRYGPEGNKLWEGFYENGFKDQKGVEYYELDDAFGVPNLKKIDGFWKKGKLHGNDIKFYDNKGILRFEGPYSDDKREGLGTVYNVDGSLEFCAVFKQGKQNDQNVRIFSEKGFPIFEGKYVNGYRKGLGRVWDQDGKLRSIGYFDGNNYCKKDKAYWLKDAQGKFIENIGKIVM